MCVNKVYSMHNRRPTLGSVKEREGRRGGRELFISNDVIRLYQT